jgi:hypothetical protein
MANIKSMTLDELLAVPYSKRLDEINTFTGFVIVPTGELHDSGFGCMKFVLTRHSEIVGAVGGGCDVVHLNGIGGYGLDWQKSLEDGMVPKIDWSIDLLPKSGCLRVFSSHKLKLGDFIGSDFEVYDGGANYGRR